MDSPKFDELVNEMKEAGLAWVEAKLRADQIDADLRPFLASLKNKMDNGKMSEAKLERLALGSSEYRQLAAAAAMATAEMLRCKVRYESLQALFEARRSEGALLRAQIEKGIIGQGG